MPAICKKLADSALVEHAEASKTGNCCIFACPCCGHHWRRRGDVPITGRPVDSGDLGGERWAARVRCGKCEGTWLEIMDGAHAVAIRRAN